jgi:hypothetical protein
MSAIYDSSGNLILRSTGSAIQIGDPSDGLTVQVTKIEMDGSDLLAEASLGPQFSWDAGLLIVDSSSAAGVSYEYVDGSLATRDTLISQNTLDIADVSSNIPTDFYSQAYVDGSLNDKLNITSIQEGTPASSAATGEQGQFQYDASYLYICTSTNTWIRILGEVF